MTPPNPIAFTVFGFSVRWYGVLIALALLIGLYLAIKRAQKRDMDIDVISEFFLWMVPAIIIRTLKSMAPKTLPRGSIPLRMNMSADARAR